MKKSSPPRRRTRKAPRKHAPGQVLSNLVENFEKENVALVEALRLFGISNAEYERAMQALTHTPVVTGASTQGPERVDAIVE